MLLLSFYGWRQLSSSQQSPEYPSISSTDVVVQVSGRVRFPGTYPFDRVVSVSDVVARAGGLVSGLQPQSRWTRLCLDNGRHLHIAAGSNGLAQVRLGWMKVTALLVLGVPLDVNRASAEQLAMIPDINKRLAARIVARRQQLGGFSRQEELLSVYGIGPVSLKRLRPYLEIGGDRGELARDCGQEAKDDAEAR